MLHSTDTSTVQDRYIRILHLRNRTVTTRETASNIPGLRWISAQRVRSRLGENGLRTRRPYFGAVLRRRDRLARVRWCNIVKGWDLQNWRRVWISDESRFMLQKIDGGTRIYRRRNERFARNCALGVDNFGGGIVMMWYAISYAENWCISTATLAPLDTEMRFWHHTCCPQWIFVGMFFSTTTLGSTTLVLLLTF